MLNYVRNLSTNKALGILMFSWLFIIIGIILKLTVSAKLGIILCGIGIGIIILLILLAAILLITDE